MEQGDLRRTERSYEVLTTPARRNEYDKGDLRRDVPGDGRDGAADSDRTSRQQPARERPPLPDGRGGAVPGHQRPRPAAGDLLPRVRLPAVGHAEQEFEPVAAEDPTRQIRLEDDAGRVHRCAPALTPSGGRATDVLLPEQDRLAPPRADRSRRGRAGHGRRIWAAPTARASTASALAPDATRPLADGDLVQFGSVGPAPAPAGPGRGDEIERTLLRQRDLAAARAGRPSTPRRPRRRGRLLGMRGGVVRRCRWSPA